MPFTLTHVAAVVPIKKMARHWLPFSALALGSTIPDMPMFLDLGLRYLETHSFVGIFKKCLPLACLFYLIFQAVMRTPLMELMPNAISDRLGERRPHTPGYLILVVVALTLGAGTHVLWDSFTHGYGVGVKWFPALREQFVFFNRSHGYYKLLQHGSSVVFLPLMAWWFYRWATGPVAEPARPYRSRLSLPLWLKLAGCTVVFVLPVLYACAEAWIDTQSLYRSIGLAARASGRYLILTALAVSLVMQPLLWMRRLPERQMQNPSE